MPGNFLATLLRTAAFSAGEPCWLTRASAFLACEAFSIGYLRCDGTAKSFVGSALRPLLVSLAMSESYVFQVRAAPEDPSTPGATTRNNQQPFAADDNGAI